MRVNRSLRPFTRTFSQSALQSRQNFFRQPLAQGQGKLPFRLLEQIWVRFAPRRALCCDVALVAFPLRADGRPQSPLARTGSTPRGAARRLGTKGPQRLVVLACEIGGRGGAECLTCPGPCPPPRPPVWLCLLQKRQFRTRSNKSSSLHWRTTTNRRHLEAYRSNWIEASYRSCCQVCAQVKLQGPLSTQDGLLRPVCCGVFFLGAGSKA